MLRDVIEGVRGRQPDKRFEKRLPEINGFAYSGMFNCLGDIRSEQTILWRHYC